MVSKFITKFDIVENEQEARKGSVLEALWLCTAGEEGLLFSQGESSVLVSTVLFS